MKKIIIVGAGDFGHEVAEYICDINNYDINLKNVIAFLDDYDEAKTENISWPIVGSLDSYQKCEGDIFVIAYGNPEVRQKTLNKIEKKSWELATIIHPTAYISKYATISPGSIICPFATVGFRACIKRNVLMNTYSAAGHHSEIGDSSVLCPKSLIAGNSIVGSQSFIGSGAIVTPGKKIGKSSSIGASSVVYRNVKEGSFIIGNPAK
jgi:sugar O-acyltransferase (sialic acid O-acetyltransferase NeuD family)